MLVVARDGGGGQEAGRAVAGVGAADGSEGVFRAVHEVGAGAAVDVQVHEAGGEGGAVQVDDFGAVGRRVGGGGNGGNAAVVDADGAVRRSFDRAGRWGRRETAARA